MCDAFLSHIELKASQVAIPRNRRRVPAIPSMRAVPRARRTPCAYAPSLHTGAFGTVSVHRARPARPARVGAVSLAPAPRRRARNAPREGGRDELVSELSFPGNDNSETTPGGHRGRGP